MWVKIHTQILFGGDLKRYVYPYEDNVDVYISDCGIYLPAQYCNELNKKYPYFPTMLGLSRHLGFRVHSNSQAIGRMWDKLREQSETYILCRKCTVIGKLVIQTVTLYDKYESAENRIKPCKITVPLSANAEARQSAKQYLDNFENQHGKVQNKLLIYINKSNYNTRIFREMLANGKE